MNRVSTRTELLFLRSLLVFLLLLHYPSLAGAQQQIDPSHVWVDFSFTGTQFGTETNPFQTLAAGVAAASNQAIVDIKPGTVDEAPTIVKPLTMRAVGGTVTLGLILDGIPVPTTDDYSDSIFPIPGDPSLLTLQSGEGLTSGFINTPGDIDYFRLNLIGGLTYGL